jgi:two-component system, cell cycle sensor histidine kinase and response regulator CckA
MIEHKVKSPLRILHLEDEPTDAALVRHTLEAAGIECVTTCVNKLADFVTVLDRGESDLILMDYSLAALDGLTAAEMLRTQWPGVPFILVSGTLQEERAIELLKRGATDYVPKDRLSQLVPAVRRAMEEVEERAERRRLEAQFVEAQKMEVIGQLAGGVAHDFNNILAVILGYGNVMMQELGAESPLYQFAEKIQDAAERAATLTRQLLVFSRKQTVQPVVLELNAVVTDMDKMLRRLIDDHVELSLVLGRDIGRVKADAGYVGQVLMNLVVNARDAMPNGGKLEVATSAVTLDSEAAEATGELMPGPYVMLRVTDTGVGMTEEVKARLFEPFFTTKPKGKGTGLGLPTCQTIVKQCGGHISVESEPGRGTTFKVYLPRVELPLDSSTEFRNRGPLPRGTETVLLVEDEPAVRQLTRRVLETQGYTVLSAANGQEGLHVAREHTGGPIRLVVTDVIMPLMSGKVMAEWLMATYPELKILFTSGYTDDAIAHHGVLHPGVAFLPKPYTPAALSRKVRETLDAP